MKKSDLWVGGDSFFWNTMTLSPCPELCQLASKVSKHVDVLQVSEEESQTIPRTELFRNTAKVRTLDPDVQDSNNGLGVMCLSNLCDEYRSRREAYLESKRGEKVYRVIKDI